MLYAAFVRRARDAGGRRPHARTLRIFWSISNGAPRPSTPESYQRLFAPSTATSSRRDAAARARAPPWGRAAPPRLPRRGPSHPRRGASPGRVHSRNFRAALSRSGPPRARRPSRAQPAPRAAQDHGEERCPEEQVQERQAQEAAQGARSASRRRRPPPPPPRARARRRARRDARPPRRRASCCSPRRCGPRSRRTSRT